MFKAVRPCVRALGTVFRQVVTTKHTRVIPTCFLRRPLSYSPASSRLFSSQVDRQFSEVLEEEIKQETENSFDCQPPTGFSVVKREGTDIFLQKSFPDGVVVEVEMDLAGSISPEDLSANETSDKEPESDPLDARPDLKIRLRKPTGRCVLFHCSLPSKLVEEGGSEESQAELPTFSVDMVEMESIAGYFVYSDLFDDNMYDHTMRLLTERGIDCQFQHQLQEFATSEEHKLYRKFLEEFKAYCKE